MNAQTDTHHPALDAQSIPQAWLAPSPTNPRKSFPPEKLEEMAASIRQHGILQPILVRPWPLTSYVWPGGHTDTPYEIIAGERRWRAAQLAGQAQVPVLIRQLDDKEVVEFQMVENLHREDLHPLEEAEGYQLLMDRHGYTAESLGAKIGKSKAYVYARLKLSALCPQAREAFYADKLTASTALLVARIPSEARQIKCVDDITNTWKGVLSYREAAQHVQAHYMLRLAQASFDTHLGDLVAGVGSCGACPKRTGSDPDLFADVGHADVCSDTDCFNAKKAAWAERQKADAEASGKAIISGKDAGNIIPGWIDPTDLESVRGGYVALLARCHEVGPRGFVEPEPEEPQASEDDDEITPDAWEAYDKAYEAWEERREAATPTYADLIQESGQTPPTVLVQHPRTGDMIECVAAADVEPLLKAAGIADKPKAATRNVDDDEATQERKALEQKVKAEAEYREALLDRILDSVTRDLGQEDLRAVATRLFEQLPWNERELVAKLIMGEPSKENMESIQRGIVAGTISLFPLMLACALVNELFCTTWNDRANEPPMALLAAAKRWGVNPQDVRQDQETQARGKKQGLRGKIKPETVASEPVISTPGDQAPAKPGVHYRHPNNGMTWSGRGKIPKWVQDWLDAGNTLDALKVTA